MSAGRRFARIASRGALAAFALGLGFFAGDAGAQPAGKPANPPVAAALQAKPAKPAQAKSSVVALVGGTVHTGAGEVLKDVTVLIEDGKIKALGKGLTVPPDAGRFDVGEGWVVTPGFTDALTSIGLIEVDLESATRDDSLGTSDKIRAAFRAIDGYNPASSVIAVTRREGVTSVGVAPSGGLISGQSAWADLDGTTAAEAIAASPLALHVHVEADAGADGHAAALLRVREAFDDARTFTKTRAAWERNQSRPFAPSRLDLEAIAASLGGKLPVVFHVNRAADILSVLALSKEFGLRPVIAGGAEAWKVAPALAAAKVPVIVFALLPGPVSFDAIAARDDNAALLRAAKVPIAISSGETHNARKLRQIAGNAVRAGLPHEAAIEAITWGPAEALGLGARYGTLSPGKVANIVVWTGDPLELSTYAALVVVRGRAVDLRSRQTALLEKYRRISR